MKNKDNKQNSKILINGSYSILLTVLLLAGLIIVNLIVNHLPVKVTQFDFSNEKLYTLTDITTHRQAARLQEPAHRMGIMTARQLHLPKLICPDIRDIRNTNIIHPVETIFEEEII